MVPPGTIIPRIIPNLERETLPVISGSEEAGRERGQLLTSLDFIPPSNFPGGIECQDARLGEKEKGRKEREKSPPLFDPNFFTRNQTSKYIYIYIYCVRSGRKALRIFLSTPLEDSRRLHPRHLARGINYRGGFTPVTVLPDRYPPSIRIKAGKGEGRERELLLAFQGSIGPRGARTSKTICSPTSSTLSLSPILTHTYQALPLPRLMQILRKLLALRAFVSPRLASPLQPPRILARQFRARRD